MAFAHAEDIYPDTGDIQTPAVIQTPEAPGAHAAASVFQIPEVAAAHAAATMPSQLHLRPAEFHQARMPMAPPQDLDRADLRWVFGYGSLIWRPDFPYQHRHPATLRGWSRRFWQGSHDHRGIPSAPGRVVTLIADAASQCLGVAYALEANVYERVVHDLDVREQNGYARFTEQVQLLAAPLDGTEAPRAHAPLAVTALVYIATPANTAFIGPASVPDLAHTIHHAHGPSGSNRDYLFELAAALRDLHARAGNDPAEHAAQDAHVFELEAAVRALGKR